MTNGETGTDRVVLCVWLWAHAGHEEELAAFEDDVLRLVPDHGGRVVHRLQAGRGGEGPREAQLLEFESDAAFQAYLSDDRRLALLPRRDVCIARTEVFRVAPLNPPS